MKKCIMQPLTLNNMKENEFEKETEKVTHLAGLTEMMGGKKHLIKEIIDVFLKQVTEELNGLNGIKFKKTPHVACQAFFYPDLGDDQVHWSLLSIFQ